jgi:hypothetical protein
LKENLNIGLINKKKHTKLSIQFAIEVLEALKFSFDIMSDMSSKTHGYRFLKEKIQELKESLNEEI